MMLKTLLISLAAAFLFVPVGAAQTVQQITAARNRMVAEEIVAAGVKNERVIEAMRNTPRHEFVALQQRPYAYFDMALPIGEGQTISPPFIVAYMTEQIDPQPTDRVLEIGTGSGYQAAVLSPLVKEVYTIEIVEPLGQRAERTLKRLKYDNVFTRIGDGYLGWPEKAPFDKIIVTCSPEKVPTPLVQQLAEGGLMVIPVGERYEQQFYLFKKRDGELVAQALRPTLFVPMTGAAEERRQVLPDPTKPQIRNGSFEELVPETDEPSAWHYQRQMERVEDELAARHGKQYVRFTNREPGRGSQALQGFAIDGRQVSSLNVSVWVKASMIRFGQTRDELPRLVVSFYDENRATIGEASIGPWSGSFDWRREQKQLAVPLKAREAIIRIGLLGAIGELSMDDVRLEPN